MRIDGVSRSADVRREIDATAPLNPNRAMGAMSLTPQDALNDIRSGQIKPVYLIHGAEDFLRTQLLSALRSSVVAPGTDAFNYHGFDPSPTQVQDAVGTAQTLPFFAERRLVVVRDCALFTAKRGKAEEDPGAEAADEPAEAGGAEGALLGYLKHPSPSTCLVFSIGDNLDSRRKASKAALAMGAGVDCSPLQAQDAVMWAETYAGKLGKRLKADASRQLVEMAGTGLWRLHSELDKLALYVGDAEQITAKDVEAAVSGTPEAKIFDLVDAIGAKQRGRALSLLEDMLRRGEEPIRLLATITWRFRLLLLVKALVAKGYGQKDGAQAAKVHPFVFQKTQQQCKGFERGELVQALERLLTADVAMKTGMDPRLTLETVVTELMG